jgi:hypothetical protein
MVGHRTTVRPEEVVLAVPETLVVDSLLMVALED